MQVENCWQALYRLCRDSHEYCENDEVDSGLAIALVRDQVKLLGSLGRIESGAGQSGEDCTVWELSSAIKALSRLISQ